MKTPKPLGIILLLILFASLFVSLTPAQTLTDTSAQSITEGNTVYVNSTQAYISASPHTLKADGYVYLNVTSKTYEGEVDFCFGFDGNQASPSRLEFYEPQTVVTSHKLDLSNYWNNQKFRINYNYTHIIDDTIYDGYVIVD